MGLDLMMFPVHGARTGNALWLGRTALDCCRRSDLFDAICKLPIEPLSRFIEFHCYRGDERSADGEPKYGRATKDPYGQKLTHVRAVDLSALAQHPGVLDNQENRAAWAYLQALPQDVPVILYWY